MDLEQYWCRSFGKWKCGFLGYTVLPAPKKQQKPTKRCPETFRFLQGEQQRSLGTGAKNYFSVLG